MGVREGVVVEDADCGKLGLREDPAGRVGGLRRGA